MTGTIYRITFPWARVSSVTPIFTNFDYGICRCDCGDQHATLTDTGAWKIPRHRSRRLMENFQ